ncbi:hypothetical protein AAAT28_11525 [Faecalibacterium duncaniae]
MTVCMGYPAMTPQGRAGKRRWKGAGNPCRENGHEGLHLLMVDPHIPAGAKLYEAAGSVPGASGT